MPIRLTARSLSPLTLALAILAASSTTPVAAQDLYSPLANWSAVGSAGAMDDSSVGLLTTEGAAAWFRPTAPAQSIGVLRFPIDRITSGICVNGFCGTYPKLTLNLTFVKNDEQAYVSAVIYRVNPANGAVSSYRAVNTLDAPAGLGGQSVSRTFSCASACFDTASIYYVEVVLWKPLATSAPKLIALSIQQSF